MNGAGDPYTILNAWLSVLKDSLKTCMASPAGLKRIHYKLSDGREMLEDWKVGDGRKARELLGRYWRRKTIFGKELQWDIEFGEESHLQALKFSQGQAGQGRPEGPVIAENNANPSIVSRSTAACYEWRIRNLPWPKDNYKVNCEGESSYCIVVSTANKKYYKKLRLAELERFKLPLRSDNVLTHFANRTLIVQYKKPLEVIELEKRVWEEIISPLGGALEEVGGRREGNPAGCPQS